ncbi:MAG: pantoate--beta-alanine ligase [Bacteroidota bacterium]
MLVFHKIKEIEEIITLQKQKGNTIGFVPTMGALHPGHISLIRFSKQQTDITVCSIFVNPTQFNNASDLTHYPRTPEADIKLLEEAGCDILYMPDVKDVYPGNDDRKFSFGYLDTILEGAHRPGHFNGVGQVVSILLQGVKPHQAFFGSKDYQQVMVVKELVKQLQLPVEIVACPILREPDGLAMSSRNTRLSAEERKTAALIPKIMNEAKILITEKGITYAKLFVEEQIRKQPTMKLEYYEVCDAETLESLNEFDPSVKSVSLIAAVVGNIRLIDNWMIN